MLLQQLNRPFASVNSLLLGVWRSPSFDQLHGETSYDQLMYNYCAHFSTYLANTLLISWLTLTVHILLFTWREYSSDQLIGCYCAHLSTNIANHLLISWLAATVHISLQTLRIIFWSADWLLLCTSLYQHGESSSDQLIGCSCSHLFNYMARIIFWSADWLLLCTFLYLHGESSSDQLTGCYCAHLSTNMANHLLISWCKCRRRGGIENNGIVTVWWEY
jgi:hypothetical protein